jgi:hypothetical protein
MTIIRMCALIAILVLVGCKESANGPDSSISGGMVSLTASSGGNDGSILLRKTDATGQVQGAVDSLVVNQAVIVLKDIKLLAAPDSAHMRDSMECEHDFQNWMRGGHYWDSTMHFRGPFIVTLRDTTPVQISLDTLPAGSYVGIRFNIHKLRSKDVQNNPSFPDSLVGYSIAVSGSARDTGGAWKPFVFKADIDEDFLVKGDFIVDQGQTLTPYVLNFDLASWFRSPTGRILDPNNSGDRWMIRWIIKAALKGHMFGGRDRNHDGHPDHGFPF